MKNLMKILALAIALGLPSQTHAACVDLATGLQLPISSLGDGFDVWATCIRDMIIKTNDGAASTTTVTNSTTVLQVQIDALSLSTAALSVSTTSLQAQVDALVASTTSLDSAKVNRAGDTMTGGLTIAASTFTVATLTNCDTIDTDGDGLFSCGTDDGGGTTPGHIIATGSLVTSSSFVQRGTMTLASASFTVQDDSANDQTFIAMRGWVLKQSTVLTATNTVDFNGLESDKRYLLYVSGVQGTADGRLQMRFNQDLTGTDYRYAKSRISSGANASDQGSENQNECEFMGTEEIDNGDGGIFKIEFQEYDTTNFRVNAVFDGTYIENTTSVLLRIYSGCQYTGIASLDNMTLLWSAGDFTGKATLWELNE